MKQRTHLNKFGLLATTAALAGSLVLGCSNSVQPTSTLSSGASGSVAVPVLITDAPSDQLVSFSLTLNSITLTNSSGKSVTILSTPTTVEICHLNGIQAPLVTASIPADTYVSATLTYSNPAITYINSTGQTVAASTVLANTSTTVTFPSAITISNSNTSLLVDLLAEKSVSISGTTVTITPTFLIRPVPADATMPSPMQYSTGKEAHGTVVSAAGNTLVITPPSGPAITFTTGASTVYQGVSGLSGLATGEAVEVEFSVQSGGTLLATRVEVEQVPSSTTAAVHMMGQVTSVSSSSFKMTLIAGFGGGLTASSTGTSYTITTNSSTTFSLPSKFGTISGLPFTPSFTAANLSAGQNVGVSAASLSGTTATATYVTLAPQTLSGTVSTITTGSGYTGYTLTLPSGSAFATLTGATSITVYTSSATVGMSSSSIAVGSSVRFNGLVFNLGSGKFAMVAGCSPDGTPGH